MPKLFPFQVVPSLPERLRCLDELAFNLRWSWDHETIELFRRIDSSLWESECHNPRAMLGRIDQRRLSELVEDEAFLAFMDRVWRNFREYMDSPGWFATAHREARGIEVAYFSAEFGLTECFQNYAGGLGILAGDHLKSASDLGIPLTGVGLLYQEGYFHQYLNVDGWQQEVYPRNDFYNLPLRPVEGPDGRQVTVEVEFPARTVHAAVWRAQVGRVPLYLLDTNIPANQGADREITGSLYGGDREHRIQQEIILGIGGMRALNALGIHPTVCHMNEGHSAFLGMERARLFQAAHGVSYAEARQATAAGNVFTTHTPVPAGFDVFDVELVTKYFGEYAARLGLSMDQMLNMGRQNRSRANEPFNMAYLAARHSSFTNAVSKLHGEVTRQMAHPAWADFAVEEVPIGHVTNGIHTLSWISLEMRELLIRYLGPRWLEDPSNTEIWKRVEQIPDEELWRTHQRRKERLVAYARRRLGEQMAKSGASDSALLEARSVLDSSHLTIGFARRFATYKRATLLLMDPARIKRILTNPSAPVQFLVAGKAHPRDDAGKEIIRQIVHFARDPEVRRRVVFLEDYDMAVARYMVQGVDVWLNTPRRPNEASGTSGMKVVANGGLNLSVLDGWWCEGYRRDVGWAIGAGEDYSDHGYQDRVEGEALYRLLESDVVPLFYERDASGLPRGWIAKMRASIARLAPMFNTNRMVAEYLDRFYLAAARRHGRLVAGGAAKAKALVTWRRHMQQDWPRVSIQNVEADTTSSLPVGARLTVRATVHLDNLRPADVQVELCFGRLSNAEQIRDPRTAPMFLTKQDGSLCHYEGELPCTQSGRSAFSVRVVPFHEDAILPYELPLVRWAGEQ